MAARLFNSCLSEVFIICIHHDFFFETTNWLMLSDLFCLLIDLLWCMHVCEYITATLLFSCVVLDCCRHYWLLFWFVCLSLSLFLCMCLLYQVNQSFQRHEWMISNSCASLLQSLFLYIARDVTSVLRYRSQPRFWNSKTIKWSQERLTRSSLSRFCFSFPSLLACLL